MYKRSRPTPSSTAILPEEVTEALLLATSPHQPPATLCGEILARAQATKQEATLPITIRSTEGDWLALKPLVQMKVLYRNGPERTYLLRLLPGAVLPAHQHDADEECMVLEGEVWLGDSHAFAGDYHLAKKDSKHGKIHSPTGALLFLRSAHPAGYSALRLVEKLHSVRQWFNKNLGANQSRLSL